MSAQRQDRRDGEVQSIFHITYIHVQTLSFTNYDPPLIQFMVSTINGRIKKKNRTSGLPRRSTATPRRIRMFETQASGSPRHRASNLPEIGSFLFHCKSTYPIPTITYHLLKL